MEIGSHDRLQEGALSLEPANGVSRYTSSDEEASMEMGQKRVGSVPPGQGSVPGHSEVSDTHQQPPCWSISRGTTSGEPVHQADMEDACNLVAFSASVGSLPPASSGSPQMQPNTAQLYQKFTREVGSEGAEARLAEGAPEGGSPPPEDLNTLLTALSQAKHGHKPPNCNCDGPDCPDYLEWLEKKIKLAVSEDQDPCEMADAPPHSQPHPQQPNYQAPPSPYSQVNGSHHLSAPYPQQQGIRGPHLGPVPSSKAPIPCSPQVLSIAKEKNISLQAAIAIEALTQLSGTGPQAMVPPVQASSNSHPHQHHQYPQNFSSHPQHGTHLLPSSPSSLSSSSRSQSVPPGLHHSQQAAMSWEQHRPQSQGQPLHVSPLPSSASLFTGFGKPPGSSPHPQQDSRAEPPGSSPHPQQDSGTGPDQRGHWMSMNSDSHSHYPPPHNSSSDPMSELKQLLGNSSGKFSNVPFKLPILHHQSVNENGSVQAQVHPGMARIKQEPDSSEYYQYTASMGCYGMVNGQHYTGPPLSPGQAAIHHSTQAALQQHLHYKRNLFSNQPPGFGSLGPRTPQTCQNLKKWWPQTGPEGLPPVAIKQEPKKKKSSSPAVKAMSGMLAGPPLPKPKQIVIKKPKQKASMPTFLPRTQITVQKASALTLDRGLASLQPGFLPLLPLLSNSTQAVAGPPVPAQTQVSISNFSMTPSSAAPSLSENTPAAAGPRSQPVASVAQGGPEGEGPQATCTAGVPPAPQTPSATSLTPSLTIVDPKYEELIRQFEAEFGDSDPELSLIQPTGRVPTAPRLAAGGSRPGANTSPSSAQSAPLAPTTPPTSATSPTADQRMEVNGEKSEGQSDTVCHQVCEGGPAEERWREALPGSLSQGANPEQWQRSALEDPFSVPFSPLPKRMKLETTSGGLAVLSTTCYSEEDTPTKDSLPCSPSLRGFLESPMRYLDTPTKNLLDTPAKDLQAEFPLCDCVEQILEKDEGPYYNHLGSGPTVASIRELMETRYGEKGDAVRVEKVVYTGREGKSSRGCPIAKWVIRRANETEKLLCLVRHRAGHHCPNAVIIILIMAWEGVPRAMADNLYQEVSDTLTKFGNPTSRRCGLNDDRTCACQGKDPDSCGASFSFGCSWSMYFNGCKYARSKIPRKFRLQGERPEQEDKLRDNLQLLATEVAPLYKQLAPQAHSNQCKNESTAPDCRLGLSEGRPFSGITACMDFCAHAHKDQHNLYNGCTVVCTLTKEDNRRVGEIPEDEQLHVLPLYKVSLTDEFGSEEGQRLKMKTGAIQELQAFRREVRKLPEPAKSCRQRRLEAKRVASEKKKSKLQQQAGATPDKTVIKTEACLPGSPHPPTGNKAIVKQEVKPTIKKEPFIDGYPAQGADLYNNIYPHPAYYARGGLPPSGQPTVPGPIVNGYHHNLPALPYGYYNYPPNALFRPELRTYEGRKASWTKAGSKVVQVDQKPDVQGLQARLAQSYSSYPDQQHPDPVNQHSAYPQQPNYSQSRPSSVSSEHSHRSTPVIKQEPMDLPVYEGSMQSQSGTNTPSTTPQPGAWPGHKVNGSIVSNSWDGYLTPKPGPAVSPFTPDKQQFHQQPLQQPSPYPQQWNSLPGSNTPMASPVPSPCPSPHPGTPHLGNIYPGTPHPASPHPGTPRPSTPHTITPRSGTPQPGTPLPGTPSHWASPAPSPQPPNAWAMGGPADYSPGPKHSSNPAGAYPDKMWSKAGGESWGGSAPLGLQEKAWKSCGGSAAGSTPSPTPEGRLFPDSLQQSNPAYWDPSRAESDMESTKSRDEDDEVWSDSEHNFLDQNIGGVAVAPTHGSILIECARRELHATTPVKRPDRAHPTRISLVFYQHKNLNQPQHGMALWETKMKLLAERALQRQQEAALLGLSQEEIKALSKKRKWGAAAVGASLGLSQAKDKREGPVTRLAPTFYTTSTVTVSPYAFTQLTGPYSHFV